MAGRVLSQDRYKYTPTDFDENGELIRNPNYMMGPLQAQAVKAGQEIDDAGSLARYDMQNQYQADQRAAADANRPYRVIQNEDEAVRLKSLMMADGARQRMGEEAWARRVGSLKAWRKDNPKPGTNPTPSLSTSPLPTGIPELDHAGETVESPRADGPYARFTESSTTYPELPEDMPKDHPDAMRLQRAREGVDMRSGGPLKTRATLALQPAVPEMKQKKLKEFYEGYRSQLPPDLQETPVMYDAMLQELLFLQPDAEEEGKWRWTTMEGTGLELGDLGDMMDPAEILSLAGSVAATVYTPQGKTGFAGKMFTMGFKNQNARYAATGLEGGLGGRFLGEGIKIGIEYMRSNGKNYPTYEQLRRSGWEAGQIELFATVAGELGAKILRTGSNIVQDRLAQIEGKVGVQGMTEREVMEANQNIMTAKADMEQAKDILGEYRISMTIGEASGSPKLIERQQRGVKNASTKVRTQFNAKKAESDAALTDYVQTVWGQPRPLGDTVENTIIKANDITYTNSRLAIVQTADEKVHIVPRPKRGPNGEIETDVPTNFGIQIEIQGAQNNAWKVEGSRLSDSELDLTNTHLGFAMYYAAHKEAQMHGGHLVSDHSVSGRAVKMWERLGDQPGIKVKRNPKAQYDDVTDQWETFGEPMFEVVPQKSYTEALLDAYEGTTVKSKPRVNMATGEMTEGRMIYKDEHFDDHLHGRHGGVAMQQIKQDTNINPYIRQRYKEMVLKNYEKHVLDPKTGEPKSGEVYKEWLHTARGRMEGIFTPEEMFMVEKMQLRRAVEATRTGLDTMDGTINRIVDIDLGALSKSDGVLSTNAKAKLVNQMRALEGRDVRRLFKMLDNVPGVPRGEFGDHIRAIVEDDLKSEILKKSQGSDWIGMGDWMKANEDLLHNIWPENAGEQMMHLRMVRDMVKRRYQAGAVQGMAEDQNPTGLALTRVIFGPLSRAQRFFSAARRGQVRGGAAKATDIIMDPDALRQFARIRSSDLESRVVARLVQDQGGWDMFPVDINEWIPLAPDGSGGEEFDSNNPRHRAAMAGYVMNALAQEEDWDARQRAKAGMR